MANESNKYKKIKDAIRDKLPIFAKYRGEVEKRTLCPHVLGYKKENGTEDQVDETVLCWQLGDDETPSAWRCFHLSALEIVTQSPDPGVWDTPENYSKWQNGVQKIKHKVDLP